MGTMVTVMDETAMGGLREVAAKRGDWATHCVNELTIGTNDVGSDMGETLADLANEVRGVVVEQDEPAATEPRVFRVPTSQMPELRKELIKKIASDDVKNARAK